MFCRTCWTNLPDGTEVCTKCGADPGSDNPEVVNKTGGGGSSPSPGRSSRPLTTPAPPAKPRRTSLTFFLIFIVIAFVGGFHLYKRRSTISDAIVNRGGAPKIATRPGARGPSLSVTAVEPPSAGGERVRTAKANIDRMAYDSLETLKALLEEEDYPLAISHAEEAALEFPKDKRFFASALAKAGEDESKNGNYSDAETLFFEAARINEKNSYLMWLAYVKLKQDDIEGAALMLDSFTQESAKGSNIFYDVYSALGTKYFFEGRTKDALAAYERGLDFLPGDERLTDGLRYLRSEFKAEEDFSNKEGNNFNVKFESGENSVTGHVIALLLEEAYIKVGTDLDFYPTDMITAVLYGGDEFRDITRSPKWAGAIYDGRIKLPVGGITEKTDLLESVLYHEYTHALVHRLANGRVPVWLNEGIAQYEEGRDTDEYEDMLKDWAESGYVKLRALEGSFMGMSSQQAGAAYLLSLSIVEYIVREYGLFSVRNILEELGGGLTIDDAINNVIYLSYSQLEEGWLNSLRR